MKSSQTAQKPARASRRLLALALGLGLASAALGTAAPASAGTAAPSHTTGAAYARYSGTAENAAGNHAFFDAVVKSVARKQAAHPDLQSVTVYYDASQAPSFRSQISSAASIWNSSVSNVKLRATTGNADFTYYEGSDPQGSYASTDGHGGGYIFLDYSQNQQYDSVRVTAHETGHVLGLPDHYSGPCSELMSGGGPGPSCTNRYPNANERARVDQLWANGLAKALAQLNTAR
ncbi:snapalysin [Streptomyces naganishii]|uniref:Extracellular small neutral protease n=1 Tax=Streptomyces naganishii JCM 4654 TaxID=1306179 RepID=A0A918Y904_9ACTN|nr:snapalysin [Streptomyces naganishii]GHD93415.1 extracellular small neutral protease [Streptomyces naganishii JCM 4654]